MEFIVTCEKGISYLENGFDGGETLRFVKGEVIREKDIARGRISIGGLERLEREGRVERVSGQKDKEAKGFKTK